MCAGFGEITPAVPFDKWHCLLEVVDESCLVVDLVLADVKGRHLALRVKGACGGKADLAFCTAYVCLRPRTDICRIDIRQCSGLHELMCEPRCSRNILTFIGGNYSLGVAGGVASCWSCGGVC